jgi:hypothetical protein
MHREAVTATIAFTAILAKITPILLSNIPFNPTQTYTAHLVYAWTTMAILFLMMFVHAGWALFVKYPYFPVDPTSMLGSIYYLCDSRMVEDVAGLSLLGEKQRRRVVAGLRDKRYQFSKMVGVSGEIRIGVDYADG